jgi:hypothetical protein
MGDDRAPGGRVPAPALLDVLLPLRWVRLLSGRLSLRPYLGQLGAVEQKIIGKCRRPRKPAEF